MDVIEINPNCPEWRAIEKYATDRIASLDLQLQAHGTPLDRTEYLRGCIAELKALLKQTKPSKIGNPG